MIIIIVVIFFFQVILPALGDNDVMVQVKACGLSRIDTKVRLSVEAENSLVVDFCSNW